MLLGGVKARDREVFRLARAVHHRGLSRKLRMAGTLGSPAIDLTVTERLTILAVLDDPPKGCEELREHLADDPAWRLRERSRADVQSIVPTEHGSC